MKKKVSNSLKPFIDELNSNISGNYISVYEIFENEYNYPELDPLRDEICKCLICGLHQAAITLTNHLLESSLKKCLIYSHTIANENEKENDFDIELIFQEGIKKYDNEKSDLSKSINAACTNGLITKEQKKKLHDFRERFRNPYSHASSQKIFKDVQIAGKVVNEIEEAFQPIDNYFNIKNIPIFQGIIQSIMSSNDSLPYFKEIDKIIRYMLLNLKKAKANN